MEGLLLPFSFYDYWIYNGDYGSIMEYLWTSLVESFRTESQYLEQDIEVPYIQLDSKRGLKAVCFLWKTSDADALREVMHSCNEEADFAPKSTGEVLLKSLTCQGETNFNLALKGVRLSLAQ